MAGSSDFEALLTELARAEVEFIVIGGVGAVLHGVPIGTFDLDIVHSRGAESRRRLVRVLAALEACYREHLPERFVPTEHDLASPLHHLLTTRLGKLDLLGTAHTGLDYEELLPRTTLVALATGVQVRVMDLRGLIEMKEQAGRDKDKLHLILLRRVYEGRKKPGNGA
ncbi:MAG: hypothetical protein HOP15_09460 [Planctomycetes bacterium]|nr:hypothetical protein [Planctomycetota bacterium]